MFDLIERGLAAIRGLRRTPANCRKRRQCSWHVEQLEVRVVPTPVAVGLTFSYGSLAIGTHASAAAARTTTAVGTANETQGTATLTGLDRAFIALTSQPATDGREFPGSATGALHSRASVDNQLVVPAVIQRANAIEVLTNLIGNAVTPPTIPDPTPNLPPTVTPRTNTPVPETNPSAPVSPAPVFVNPQPAPDLFNPVSVPNLPMATTSPSAGSSPVTAANLAVIDMGTTNTSPTSAGSSTLAVATEPRVVNTTNAVTPTESQTVIAMNGGGAVLEFKLSDVLPIILPNEIIAAVVVSAAPSSAALFPLDVLDAAFGDYDRSLEQDEKPPAQEATSDVTALVAGLAILFAGSWFYLRRSAGKKKQQTSAMAA